MNIEESLRIPTELNSGISAVSADRQVTSNQVGTQQTRNVQISKAGELRQAGVLIVDYVVEKGKEHSESLDANVNMTWGALNDDDGEVTKKQGDVGGAKRS
jgi:hypothetical protein